MRKENKGVGGKYMIINIGISVCIGLAIIGLFKEKSIINPLTTFCGIWTVVLLCSLTYPKLTTPQDEIYEYITIGTVVFGIGYFWGSRRKKQLKVKLGNIVLNDNDTVYTPKSNALFVLGIICVLAYLYNLYLVVSGAGSLATAAIKAYLQTFTMQKSSWLNAFYFLLIEPLSTAIPIIAISNFVFGKKDKKLLIISITLVLIKTVANATRNTVMVILVYFIIGTVEYIKRYNLTPGLKAFVRRRKRQIVFAILGGIVLFVYMTVARGNKLLENLWVDFALPPRLFEVWKEEVDSRDIYGYGFGSLQGFIFPVFYVLKNVLKIPLPTNIEIINDLITRTDTVFVWPGERVTANAYVSLYWFFYLDGRLCGIIIGSFLIGYFSSKMYRKFICNKSERSFTLYCFWFNVVVFSLVRVQFTNVSFALALIYTCFLYKRQGRKI